MEEICDFDECKEDMSRSNPKVLLEILSNSLGYQKKEFHSIECFLKFICKKYKRKIKKLGWKKKK